MAEIENEGKCQRLFTLKMISAPALALVKDGYLADLID